MAVPEGPGPAFEHLKSRATPCRIKYLTSAIGTYGHSRYSGKWEGRNRSSELPFTYLLNASCYKNYKNTSRIKSSNWYNYLFISLTLKGFHYYWYNYLCFYSLYLFKMC